MITKYDTGDEVLIPVRIDSARISEKGEIYYTVKEIKDVVIPEGLIEGKAKIGEEKYIHESLERELKS